MKITLLKKKVFYTYAVDFENYRIYYSVEWIEDIRAIDGKVQWSAFIGKANTTVGPYEAVGFIGLAHTKIPSDKRSREILFYFLKNQLSNLKQ